jgi:ATP-binding cassette, subfamily B, bacterial HlyB/CyaB
MKSHIIRGVDARRLGAIPYPAIVQLKNDTFVGVAVAADKGKVRLVDPVSRSVKEVPLDEPEAVSSGLAVLFTRRRGGAGVDPNTFGFRWFWPSILRYRRPLAHVISTFFRSRHETA